MLKEWVADKVLGRFSEGVVRETGQEPELDRLGTKGREKCPSVEEYLISRKVITTKNPLTLAIRRSLVKEILFSFLQWCW